MANVLSKDALVKIGSSSVALTDYLPIISANGGDNGGNKLITVQNWLSYLESELDDIVGNLEVTGILTVSDTTQSTTKDNGSVVIEGGVGIEKNVNIGGAVVIDQTLDITGGIFTDTVDEITSAAGVTVDGVLVKDSSVALADGLVSNLAVKIGADANNGIYGVSDTQMGFAIEGVLVGGANTTGLFTDVISEQTTTVGVTVDGLLIKDGGASANSMFAGFFPTTAAQALSGAGAVNVTAYLTKFTSTGGADALTIASGTQIGQRKKVQHVVDGGGGVLTGVFVGGTTITFTAVAEFCDLMWTGTSWAVLELGNTAAPGTPPVLA